MTKPTAIVGLALFAALLLLGCAAMFAASPDWAFRHYEHPNAVVLQDPLPGQALVYLLRAPHDRLDLEIMSDGMRLARLPERSFIALSLPPGDHRLVTLSSSLFAGSEQVVEPLEIKVKPNQRVFYYVTGSGDTSTGLATVMPIPGAGAVPLLTHQSII